MTDPLEQRLREALEAYAETVSPDALDPAKEEAFREAISPRSAWRAVLLGGAAAAAVVIGAATTFQFTDGGRSPVADSDPTISATTKVDQPTDRSASRPQSSAESPASRSAGATTSRTPERQSSPAPTSAPRQTATPSVPDPERPTATPSPPAVQPTGPGSATTAPPEARSSEADPPASTSSPTEPGTTAPSPPPTSLQVSVRATPRLGLAMSWDATARGQVQADVPRLGVLGYRVSYGDGRSAEAPLPGTCEPVAPVQPVTLPISPAQSVHVYTRPGTYQVTVAVTYCANAGVLRTATDSAAVTVK